MNQAKIRLSEKEMELLMNAEWILTKNGILQKIWQLLELVQSDQQKILADYPGLFTEAVLAHPAKISKGENYKGLPWLVLDFPRCFTKEDKLAIRTMFWWGNFFSITLHLSGSYKREFERAVLGAFSYLQDRDYSLCIHQSEWEHHFETDNYIPLKEISPAKWQDDLKELPFIKIAKKFPLFAWDDLQDMLSGNFRELLELLAFNYQAGEKGLSPGDPTRGFGP
jgi:hypothetical protein